jgi:hypothetical protein
VVRPADHSEHPDIEGHEAQHLVRDAGSGVQCSPSGQGGIGNAAGYVIHGITPFWIIGVATDRAHSGMRNQPGRALAL